jgi:ribonuclease-3
VGWLSSVKLIKKPSLRSSIRNIFGFYPSNIKLFELALRHSSVANETTRKGFKESNERLEFLGDAILSSVVAEYLFLKFPFKDEGFLTEMRSRIVSRTSLNKLAVKIGIDQLVEFDQNNRNHKSIAGNSFEAIIGAIFLDKGYRFVNKLLISRLITVHIDVEELEKLDLNFKSRLLNWAQAEKHDLRFDTAEMIKENHKFFITTVLLNHAAVSEGNGLSKKNAEQHAAENACKKLLS